MISRKRKGKGRVKTVVDFGMLDDNTVCRVRTVNGDCANAVRRLNAEASVRQLLERTLRMRLTDRPFEKMFTFTIEPRSVRGRVGEESGTIRNYKILMISKECDSITSQQIDGVTDGGCIVSAMMGTASMLNTDAFFCFVCTYEIPMYDFYAEPGDPPSEWEERQFAAKTLDGLLKHIRTDLNVEE